jgi:hypothetical protein
MISLCLQCCPLDIDATLELARLICDLEPERREQTEFFLVYRKDTPLYVPMAFEGMAKPKFGRAMARIARNYDDGWPGGSNMLAASAFLEMSILKRGDICRNDAFLLFEPDTVPLAPDWIDQLSAEWDRVKAGGKEAFGIWHQQAGPETLHLNGNAVFEVAYYDKHLNLMIGPSTMGWDWFYRDHLIPISQDSDLMAQMYATGTITPEQFDGITKNGQKPVFLHGVKDNSARLLARKRLLSVASVSD